MLDEYRPRVIDEVIDKKLATTGAVLIEGCKWCGKTTSAKQHARSVIEFQDPDRQGEYQEIVNTRPSLFLSGEKPRLIDEWQRYPVVWDAVRVDVDRSNLTGQYLLTGSAKPAEGVTMHTGTGRISRLVMRPMSLYEQGFSDGKVSLADIVAGEDINAANEVSLEQLADYIVWGGWPRIPALLTELRSDIARDYVNSVLHEEVQNIDGVERNYDRMRAVLASLARNISSPVSIATIERDTELQFGGGVSRVTVRDYLNTLQKLFVYYNVTATTLKFRSRAVVRSTSKKELVDPSIAAAVLGVGVADLMGDLRTFGLLFECMVMRDLIVYLKDTGENVHYFRDADGNEVDAILHTADGKWGAVEIKLGTGKIDEAAQNLLKFRNMLDVTTPPPAFLMVITGGNYSYRRDDGVYVVSIGSLKD